MLQFGFSGQNSGFRQSNSLPASRTLPLAQQPSKLEDCQSTEELPVSKFRLASLHSDKQLATLWHKSWVVWLVGCEPKHQIRGSIVNASCPTSKEIEKRIEVLGVTVLQAPSGIPGAALQTRGPGLVQEWPVRRNVGREGQGLGGIIIARLDTVGVVAQQKLSKALNAILLHCDWIMHCLS